MLRATALASTAALGLVLVVPAGAAEMQSGRSATEMQHHPMYHYRMTHEHMMRHHDPHVTHGTGYHGHGTATGGPVGGLPSRN